MVPAPVPPAPPAPSVPFRPTAPVPSTVSAFAARLDHAAGRAGGAGGATTAGAPTGAGVRTTRSHALAATTLGAMLRAGLSTAPLGPAAPAPTVAAATAAVPTTAVDRGATVGTGAGPLAGRLIAQPVDGRVSSTFGPRVHPIHGGVRDHHGLDVAAPTGTPVRAVTDGTVVRVGDAGGYGLLVEVDHGDGVTSRYAHLSTADVTVGDRLEAGTPLGGVGSTGASTGPHLHLEIRVDGEPVDPQLVLGTA